MDPYAPEFREDHSLLTEAQAAQESKESFSDPGVKTAIIINIAGGLVYGVGIGCISVVLQFNQYLGDCSRYTNVDACNKMTYTGCRWVDDATSDNTNTSIPAFCGFPDHNSVNCTNFFSQDSCANSYSGESCFWQYHKEECSHLIGWSANEQGLLAGIQIIGAMIAAAFSGPLANKIGRKKSLLIAGIVTVIACLFFTIGWKMKENYALLLIAELFVGIASGQVSVVCPMMSSELVSGPKMQEAAGIFFQLFCTFGIFLCGLVGLILDPESDTANPDADLQDRFQWVIALQWLTAAGLLAVYVWAPESPLWIRQMKRKEEKEGQNNNNNNNDTDKAILIDSGNTNLSTSNQHSMMSSRGEEAGDKKIKKDEEDMNTNTNDGNNNNDHEEESNSLSDLFTRENALPLIIGIFLSIAQQFTGINSIILYFIKMSAQIGLSPLLGNCLMTLVNFLTCLPPIYLVQKFSCRQLFIVGCAVCALACAIAAIGVWPGVFEAESSGQQALSLFGIALFIASFEFSVGPCFYVLGCSLGFSTKARSMGVSWCIWTCFTFNAVINWGFPVAVTALSGGPSGNQNKGLANMFVIFSVIAFICFLVLGLKMPKSNSEVKHDANKQKALSTS